MVLLENWLSLVLYTYRISPDAERHSNGEPHLCYVPWCQINLKTVLVNTLQSIHQRNGNGLSLFDLEVS